MGDSMKVCFNGAHNVYRKEASSILPQNTTLNISGNLDAWSIAGWF